MREKKKDKKIVIQYSSTGELEVKEAVRRIIEAHEEGRYEEEAVG